MFRWDRLCWLPTGLLLATVVVLAAASTAGAQHPQAAVTVPFNQAGGGFYEQIGTNWGVHAGNHFFFNFGGGAAVPPFGGFVPGAGLQTGAAVHGPGGIDGYFNITAGQGAQTSLVGQSVTTTMPSAVPASLADTSQAPFVLGAVPVVGDMSTSPLEERLERMKEGGAAAYGPRSGHGRSGDASAADAASGTSGQVPAGPPSSAVQPPAGSVAQLAALREAAEQAKEQARQQELDALIAKAREAEATGKAGQARIFYRQAAARAASPLKEQLLDRARTGRNEK